MTLIQTCSLSGRRLQQPTLTSTLGTHSLYFGPRLGTTTQASASLQTSASRGPAVESSCRASRHQSHPKQLPPPPKHPPPRDKVVPLAPQPSSSSPVTAAGGGVGLAAETPDQAQLLGTSRSASRSISRERSSDRWMRMQRLSCSACRIHTEGRGRPPSRI